MIQTELKKWQARYTELTGRPCRYFFCPILFTDERVEHCMGHIVNEAFPNSPKNQVLQRKDVDNFYGANFESAFVAMRVGSIKSIGELFTDRTLRTQLKPRILVDNKSVDYFQLGPNSPKAAVPLNILDNSQTVRIGLKMSPDEVLAAADKSWDIAYTADLRIAAMVSLIKAAHLTLFSLLGYHYALTASGLHVGKAILGDFYLKNQQIRKQSKVLDMAYPFFREYAHTVRPLMSTLSELKGTISDNTVLICQAGSERPWAIIVFIRVMDMLHAVLVPTLEDAQGAMRYHHFLSDETEKIATRWARYKNDHWELDPQATTKVIYWPKTGTLYPD